VPPEPRPNAFPRDELISFSGAPIVSQTRPVRFQEVDAAGTIFFPRVLEYFSDAYQELLERAGIDTPRILRERAFAAPLAHAEADYLSPLFFGDTATVELLVARVGSSSVRFGHRVKKGDAVAAIGSTVHVFVDGKTFKPTPVPAALTAYLEARS
jgi:1,4-dihydroxy-2-naphthoyl-CoA hydrolase